MRRAMFYEEGVETRGRSYIELVEFMCNRVARRTEFVLSMQECSANAVSCPSLCLSVVDLQPSSVDAEGRLS